MTNIILGRQERKGCKLENAAPTGRLGCGRMYFDVGALYRTDGIMKREHFMEMSKHLDINLEVKVWAQTGLSFKETPNHLQSGHCKFVCRAEKVCESQVILIL